jgi:hypothetical protein
MLAFVSTTVHRRAAQHRMARIQQSKTYASVAWRAAIIPFNAANICATL